jgi:hypothetical protein
MTKVFWTRDEVRLVAERVILNGYSGTDEKDLINVAQKEVLPRNRWRTPVNFYPSGSAIRKTLKELYVIHLKNLENAEAAKALIPIQVIDKPREESGIESLMVSLVDKIANSVADKVYLKILELLTQPDSQKAKEVQATALGTEADLVEVSAVEHPNLAKRPRVLVIGPKGAQKKQISTRVGNLASLVFVESGNSAKKLAMQKGKDGAYEAVVIGINFSNRIKFNHPLIVNAAGAITGISDKIKEVVTTKLRPRAHV